MTPNNKKEKLLLTAEVEDQPHSYVYDLSDDPLPSQPCPSQFVKNLRSKPEEFSSSVPRPLTFLETNMKRASRQEDDTFLTTGCEVINSFLRGGIPCFGLTEIYGESAAAKTQLCLQLSLYAQLAVTEGGLESGALYINTEGSGFPIKRISQMSEYFSSKFNIPKQENPLDNVIIEVALDHESLAKCLNQRLPKLLKEVGESRIRLIIIDSIAGIYRSDYEDMEQRTNDLRKTGKMLHELARTLKIAVVVVNQVTAAVATNENVPSLGLVWTNMVTTRLHLIRRQNDRFLEIVHAPHLRPGSLKISLTDAGLCAANSTSFTTSK